MRHALVAFYSGHPRVAAVATILAAVWIVGWLSQTISRPRGNLQRGAVKIGRRARKGGRWAWTNRQDVLRALAWSAIVAVPAAFAVVVWASPTLGMRVVIPATIAALAYGGWWVDEHVGDAPLRQVVAEWVGGRLVRSAAALTPEVRVARPRALGHGGWEARVHVADGTDLDGLAVAARAVASGIEARSVEVIPGDQIGNAIVRISPEAPEPNDPWQGLDRIVPWPGPSSTNADDRVPVAFDRRGRTLTIPGPRPADVEHVGVAGATRRGKSAFLVTLLAELAHRDHLALVLLDPAMVEFAPWRPRASRIYTGAEECREGVTDVLDVVTRRYERVTQLGRRTAPVGDGWPRIVIVVDEVAALIDKPKDATSQGLARISEQAGKMGMQLIVATQRPEVGVWEGRLRDNLLTRIGFKHSSGEGSRMTTGPGGPDLTEIPKTIRGALMIHHDMEWTRGRGYLVQPSGPVPADEEDEALGYAAAEIAAATAHLRIPWEEL